MSPIFVFLYTFLFQLFPLEPNPTYLVTKVYDGDSFQVDNIWQVRLTNVDAPETGLCLSENSKEYLSKLILNKRVSISGKMFDDFGRLLSQVYIGKSFINEQMIISGLARYTSGAFPQKDLLMGINYKNKQNKIGVFSSTCFQATNPINPQCNIKGNVKDKIKTYAYPGCGTYNQIELSLDEGDQWFCTQAEAVSAGFVKAKNCY